MTLFKEKDATSRGHFVTQTSRQYAERTGKGNNILKSCGEPTVACEKEQQMETAVSELDVEGRLGRVETGKPRAR